MPERIDSFMGKTSEGDIFVILWFSDHTVSIELLQRQIVFTPKLIVHEGKFCFSGTYSKDGHVQSIIIPATNDAVRFYEKATAS